jgi:outer membrane receptor protein involved in Fe transport
MQTGLLPLLSSPLAAALRRAGRSLALAALLLPLALAAKPIKFDIPAQPAADALIVFSKQAGVDVLYSHKDLSGVRSQPVAGEHEPEAALAVLLKGTGFEATRDDSGKFVVTREKPRAAPVVTGTVVNEDTGKPVAGARVRVVDSAVSAFTDRSGRFRLEDMPAGAQSVVILADDYAPTRVTDVNARAGAVVTVGEVILKPRKEGVTKLEEYVVSAQKDVVELESLEVGASKIKPFTDRNVDIPRGIDDAQPYYVFSSRSIEQSGATNVEDFLQKHLTMNTNPRPNSYLYGSFAAGTGVFSTVNLRGLGNTQTLILINGRRAARVSINGTLGQTDLNGVPLSAIDRIEVLPASAGAIYGGSAVGGVLNVILKKDYQGGEVRFTYDTPWDTDAPLRTTDATYGFALEGGKTHVMITGHYADGKPLLNRDRVGLMQRGISTILKNDSANLYDPSFPFSGATPNIASTDYTNGGTDGPFGPGSYGDNLVLKNGTPLNSTITFVPAGTAAGSGALGSALVANAGKYNLTLPSGIGLNGLDTQVGTVPRTKSLLVSIRRDMARNLEAFTEFSTSSSIASFKINPFGNFAFNNVVPASAPSNPFQQDVVVDIPSNFSANQSGKSVTQTLSTGLRAKLPADWNAEFDFTWSQSFFNSYNYYPDGNAIQADLNSGALNPFVDTLAYPLALGKYLAPNFSANRSTLNGLAVRASGPLLSLPWGRPTLTVSLEHRKEGTGNGANSVIYPISLDQTSMTTYFGQTQSTNSVYAETWVPIVTAKNALPLLRSLDLQLAVRSEAYSASAVTPSFINYINDPARTARSNGTQGLHSKTSYISTNPLLAVRYSPARDLILRASYSTAFLPPTNSQLLLNPTVSTSTTNIFDPTAGRSYRVFTTSGGNPSLTPEKDHDIDVGAIYEPKEGVLRGVRLELDYFNLQKRNVIGSLTAVQIAANQSLYPNRVTRSPATGLITQIDTSLLNLNKVQNVGYSATVAIRRETPWGTFDLSAMGTIMEHYRLQRNAFTPLLEYVGSPANNGPIKSKGNGTLTWEFHRLTLGWTTEFYGSYKQFGAAGDPTASGYTPVVSAQGGERISSSVIHSLFASWAFPRAQPGAAGLAPRRLLSGMELSIGIKNVFNTLPPFDAFYAPYYILNGDPRMRDVWVSVKKTF